MAMFQNQIYCVAYTLVMIVMGARPLYIDDLSSFQVYMSGVYLAFGISLGFPGLYSLRKEKRKQSIMDDELLAQAIDNDDKPAVDLNLEKILREKRSKT